MSRSRKKNPFCGITTARSDRPSKTRAHRQERAAARAAITTGAELPSPRAFGDPWDGNKDGKQRLDPERHARNSRK